MTKPHIRRRRRARYQKNSICALSILLALLIGGTAGLTVAYLSHRSGITNEFETGNVETQVEENFDGDTKTDAGVANTGNVPAYVRVAVTVYWEDKDGNILWGTPGENADYSILWNLSEDPAAAGWVRGSDGCYYYTVPLEPEGADDGTDRTEALITSCREENAEEHRRDGRYLVVDIAAQSVQAEPSQAVVDAWGSENGGSVRSVGSDGSLVIEAGSTDGEGDGV